MFDTTTGITSVGPPRGTPGRTAFASISWPSSVTDTWQDASPSGSRSTWTNSSSTRSGTSPERSFADRKARSRASRSRRLARSRSSAALPTTRPTTTAIARKTTAAIRSRSCSKPNTRWGDSTIGRAIEASKAATTPAQRPPLTAAIVTERMKIATPAPWSWEVSSARTVPASVARKPMPIARSVNRARRPGGPSTTTGERYRPRDARSRLARVHDIFTPPAASFTPPSRPMPEPTHWKEVFCRTGRVAVTPRRFAGQDGYIHRFPPSPSSGPAAPSSCRPQDISGVVRGGDRLRPKGHVMSSLEPGVTLLPRCGS